MARRLRTMENINKSDEKWNGRPNPNNGVNVHRDEHASETIMYVGDRPADCIVANQPEAVPSNPKYPIMRWWPDEGMCIC